MSLKTVVLTGLAMTAFAANSIFCRFALGQGGMDAGAFALIRLVSGAIVLGILSGRHAFRAPIKKGGTPWAMPLMLALYALFFSYAYVSLGTGTGALILFSAVQATMICAGVLTGERPRLSGFWVWQRPSWDLFTWFSRGYLPPPPWALF